MFAQCAARKSLRESPAAALRLGSISHLTQDSADHPSPREGGADRGPGCAASWAKGRTTPSGFDFRALYSNAQRAA